MADQIMRPGSYEDVKAADTLAQSALDMDDKDEAKASEADKKDDKKDARTPIERWHDNLKLVELSEEQAGQILDSMISRGYWEKEYALFRGRLPITLRTRTSYSNQRVTAAVDALRNPNKDTYNNVMLRQQLAGSLAKYKDLTFKRPGPGESNELHDEAHIKALDFIDKGIPEHVLSAVYEQLVKFDMLVRAALSEGSVEGF